MTETMGAFLESWNEDANQVKPLFQAIHGCLSKMEGVSLEYLGRPGISHSLRAKHSAQKRPLFVLVDVIDDEPDARWLSICFYADLVADPAGLGDVVPGGLMGEDARCFDIDEAGEVETFILECLKEAYKNAAKETLS